MYVICTAVCFIVVQIVVFVVIPLTTTRVISTQGTTGSVVTLTCVVEGVTNPDIRWTREGRLLPNDPRYVITPTVSGSQLTIYNARAADGGSYECTATGTRTSQIITDRVIVVGRMEILPIHCWCQ